MSGGIFLKELLLIVNFIYIKYLLLALWKFFYPISCFFVRSLVTTDSFTSLHPVRYSALLFHILSPINLFCSILFNSSSNQLTARLLEFMEEGREIAS